MVSGRGKEESGENGEKRPGWLVLLVRTRAYVEEETEREKEKRAK